MSEETVHGFLVEMKKLIFMESEAFVEWIRTFPEVLDSEINSIEDLRDCRALVSVWNALSPNQIPLSTIDALNDERDWISVLKNFKTLGHIVQTSVEPRISMPKIEFTSIARQNNNNEIAKLFFPFVLAAVTGPDKKNQIQKIKSLSSSTQNIIKGFIRSFKTQPRPESEPNVDDISKEAKLKVELELTLKNIEQAERELASLREDRSKSETKRSVSEESLLEEAEILYNRTQESISSLRFKIEESEHRASELKAIHDDLAESLHKRSKSFTLFENQSKMVKELTQELNSLIDSHEKSYERGESVQKEKDVIVYLEKELDYYNEQVKVLKEELTTSIQIASKYHLDISDEDLHKPDPKQASVPQLLHKINNLELGLSAINDMLLNGPDAVSSELLDEQKRLKNYVSQLHSQKQSILSLNEKAKSLRGELQRVQEDIVQQNQKEEVETEALTRVIHEKNAEISTWVTYSASLKSNRSCSTFLSDMRSKYY